MIRASLIPIVAILFCYVSVSAQQASSASGSNATGIGGTLSYTVGQIDYTSLNSPAGTFSLGVQQPYIVIANEKDFQILIFPNPTPTAVTVRILSPGSVDLRFLLYDLFGRQLLDQHISAAETNIPLMNYRPATYILQVRIDQQIRTYKIIKTNNP